MGAITFNRFDLGIDLRKGASVSDANRLREMKNAYVTTGLATQKRPGLVKVTSLEPGTKGLFSALGKLHTFYGAGNIVHADTRFQAHKTIYYSGQEKAVADVLFADVFNGNIYASILYDNTDIRHHYLDGTADPGVTDGNCPQSAQVLKIASKIFAVSRAGDTVRYSKTGNPRDWTTVNDAGFLPTGLNARGDRSTNALGIYQNKLVALARDGAQVWFVDPDPSANKLEDIVENVGTSFHRTVATVAGDLYFLSDFGFRSITTLQLISKLADVDIGSPIDTLVRPETRKNTTTPRAAYYYGTGQYICAIGDQLFVYSISRTAKVAAWSRYILPFTVDAFAELQGVLYIRSGDNIYQLSDEVSADDGQPFEVLLELPYMDFKSPGQTKRVYGVDLVMEGECDFSIAFDVRNPDAYTPPVRVRGNTRGGGVIPIECAGTEFSLRFRNFDDKPFRLDAVTVYYDNLGAI
ncbi:hypothetical protein [Ensifer sp. SSB1]|uniref:hypothetical protein n=1 Tax=Ensifer sp. SSB1 TaxID=2795385 RepID=UPI001A4D565E|nr:hypothetical protein [Ensifer sp. SSB1]MBK5570097.1 hypothetical protein [Ensifer sp. SSB1]